MLGIPVIVVSNTLVPSADGLGGLAWRALDSAAYPWLPATAAMMWGFAIVTCTVISWIIYGLRVEVRQARRLGACLCWHGDQQHRQLDRAGSVGDAVWS